MKSVFRSAHLFTSADDLRGLLSRMPASDPRVPWVRQMLEQIAGEPGAVCLGDLPL